MTAALGIVKLGGREYSIVNYDAISSLHEHYVMKFMRSTGLDRMAVVMDGETDEAFLLRLEAALVDTLQLHELLAAFLLPAGVTELTWTPAGAQALARQLKALAGADDKATIHQLGLQVVLSFFAAGVASLNRSLSVLESTTATTETTPRRGPIAARLISAIGRASSAVSRAMTSRRRSA